MKVAFIAPYPASAVLLPSAVKPKYRDREHPAPWVLALAGALARRGDTHVRVFVDSRAVRRREAVSSAGVEYVFLKKWEPIRSDPYHGYLPGVLRMRREFADFKPDVVHGFGTESGCGPIAAGLPYPSVVFIQGILEKVEPWHDLPALTFFLLKQTEKRVLHRASAFIAETHFAKEWVLKHNPKAVVRVIPHAMSDEFMDIRPDFREKRCLCVGTINRIKGTDAVIRAFALCGYHDATLVLVGDGPEMNRCRRLSAELGVSGRVVFAGRLDRDGVRREMQHARMLVLGSRMDTSPNVITEAHAAGLPVVGTSAGGIPEMIADGCDGFMVTVDNPESMATRMGRLLADPALAKRLGEEGRRKVKHLNDPARIAEEHVSLYYETTCSRGHL